MMCGYSTQLYGTKSIENQKKKNVNHKPQTEVNSVYRNHDECSVIACCVKLSLLRLTSCPLYPYHSATIIAFGIQLYHTRVAWFFRLIVWHKNYSTHTVWATFRVLKRRKSILLARLPMANGNGSLSKAFNCFISLIVFSYISLCSFSHLKRRAKSILISSIIMGNKINVKVDLLIRWDRIGVEINDVKYIKTLQKHVQFMGNMK